MAVMNSFLAGMHFMEMSLFIAEEKGSTSI